MDSSLRLLALSFCVSYFLSTPITALWTDNELLKLHSTAAMIENKTDCWVCSHIPTHSLGTPILGVPFTWTDFEDRYVMDFSTLDPELSKYREISGKGDEIMKAPPALILAGIVRHPSVCFTVFSRKTRVTINGKQIRIPKILIGETTCNSTDLNITQVPTHYEAATTYAHCVDETKVSSTIEPCLSWANKSLEWDLDYIDGPAHYNIKFLTLQIRNQGFHRPMVLPSGTYYICGKKAYAWLPMGAEGRCTIGNVVPAVRTRTELSATSLIDTHSSAVLNLKIQKRELFNDKDKAWAFFPALTGWGIEMMARLNEYASLLDRMINNTVISVLAINVELAQIRKVALQNRMVLDYLLAEQGGVCVLVGEECCTYINDSESLVESHMAKVFELQKQARDISKNGFNPFTWLGNIGGWLNDFLGSFFKPILVILALALGLYLVVKVMICAISRCTSSPASALL
ncbi:uncharacterized protein LOC121397684 [Xenopus laevis]|uniref:Uncharacterized protein LOC121397684 n=1 Tax=Xenopus laevis TaxID=8355 RepID=A0A8J1LNQ9_XENLA|nr:uncharacterized protein LOC121397684 [Xenopus laevis]XP_041430801.1 uncharacterized protein LOC121397684 [Xenopus laevis]